MVHLSLKFVHIIGSIVILGTGAGIAFFMVMAHRTKNPAFIADTAGIVVIADMIFTATAVVIQPLTGYFLVKATGRSLTDPWIAVSIALFVGAGLFWLPVVWLQMKMRDLAQIANANDQPLPLSYHRYFRIWFLFGIPGFGFTVAILWLMVFKPF